MLMDIRIASWQSDDGVTGTEIVLTDPKPVDEGNAIHIQCVQFKEKLNYWFKPYGDGKNLYMGPNNVKLSQGFCQWAFSGLCGTLKMLTWLWMAWYVFQVSKNQGGGGYVLENIYWGKPALNWRGRSGNFS